jgi:hypothetical protein
MIATVNDEKRDKKSTIINGSFDKAHHDPTPGYRDVPI